MRRGMLFERTMGLDMARGSLETGGVLTQVTVDMDVTGFPTLKGGFMVSRMVLGEGSVMVATSPPDFSMSDGNFFFFSQRGR